MFSRSFKTIFFKWINVKNKIILSETRTHTYIYMEGGESREEVIFDKMADVYKGICDENYYILWHDKNTHCREKIQSFKN